MGLENAIKVLAKVNQEAQSDLNLETLEELCTTTKALKYRINVHLNVKKCCYCSGVGVDCIHLDCGHLICSKECFQELGNNFTAGDLKEIFNLICPRCGQKVPLSTIQEAYGGPENLQHQIQLRDKAVEPRFTCKICFEESPVSEGVTLECEHRFCQVCTEAYLRDKIQNAQVAENNLVCPDCGEHINPQIIKAQVDESTFLKFERFSIEGWTPQEPDCLHFKCKGTDCDFQALLSIRASKFSCPKCNKESCAKCGMLPHPEVSCDKLAKKMFNLQNDRDFKDLRSKMLQCPVCFELIEKEGGCKYMTCTSKDCKGKTYFCSDCLKHLKKNHQKHECHTPDILRNRCLVF